MTSWRNRTSRTAIILAIGGTLASCGSDTSSNGTGPTCTAPPSGGALAVPADPKTKNAQPAAAALLAKADATLAQVKSWRVRLGIAPGPPAPAFSASLVVDDAATAPNYAGDVQSETLHLKVRGTAVTEEHKPQFSTCYTVTQLGGVTSLPAAQVRAYAPSLGKPLGTHAYGSFAAGSAVPPGAALQPFLTQTSPTALRGLLHGSPGLVTVGPVTVDGQPALDLRSVEGGVTQNIFLTADTRSMLIAVVQLKELGGGRQYRLQEHFSDAAPAARVAAPRDAALVTVPAVTGRT